MAAIEWTGRETRDRDTLVRVLQAKVGNDPVSVYVSDEAYDDVKGDLGRIQAAAEDKIRSETTNGKPPKKVFVLTADIQP